MILKKIDEPTDEEKMLSNAMTFDCCELIFVGVIFWAGVIAVFLTILNLILVK